MSRFLALLLLALCALLFLNSADARPGHIYPPRRYAHQDYLKARPALLDTVATVATPTKRGRHVHVPVPAQAAPPAPEWHQVPADSLRARRWRAPEPGLRVQLHRDPGHVQLRRAARAATQKPRDSDAGV